MSEKYTIYDPNIEHFASPLRNWYIILGKPLKNLEVKMQIKLLFLHVKINKTALI